MQNNVSQWCSLLGTSLILFLGGQVATVAVPSAVVLAISLFPVPAHAQVACETPDTDFDGDDPDPCTPPAQVDPAATGPADGATIGPTQSTTGPTWNSATTAPTPCQSGGCTGWAFEPMVVSLQLHDMPVGYTPPVGPSIQFNLYYSQRDVQQPATFKYTNFGPQWTTTYLSFVTDTTSSNGTATLYLRGGGAEPYTFSTTPMSQPGPYSEAVLTKATNASGGTIGFTRQLPDGSVEQFGQAQGNQFFMTAIIDRQGNKVTLTYGSQARITSLTDAVGQVTTLTYGLTSDPLKVTQVTDPFGRSATFTYTATGQLASITDVLGITSSYTYGTGNFISALKTPYGTTTFSYGDSTTDPTLGTTRFLVITDALGRVSRVEFNQNAPGVAASDATVPSGMNTSNAVLNQRVTYIWNPNQYAAATASGTLDYTKAKAIHWMANADGSVSRVIESVLEPLESRVWYDYPGQPVNSAGTVGTSNLPLHIGRVLSDGSTQLQTFQYNAAGNITQVTDPVGRQITYTYAANGIDLLTITNTTAGASQLLATLTYNSQHEPLTITAANGATATYQYNAAWQPTKITDPLGNITSYTYDGSGHLTTVQGPVSGAQYAFTYDGVGRIASATDPAGSTVSYAYDAADRPTGATFPDGTSSQFTYNLLDLASTTDRLGQKTTLTYDAQRELIQVTDPLGQGVKLGYGPDGTLSSIVDPNGNKTMVTLDVEGRAVSKLYADGSLQSITYDSSTSRVQSTTDALSQVTAYTYNADNTVASIAYSTSVNPTAGVAFTYDPAYSRVISMTDAIGTTTYSYYPISTSSTLGANQLQTVTSPIAGALAGNDAVNYTYDALNRVVGRSINGSSESTVLDAIGRVTSVTNPLDAFTYSYADATPRVTGVTSNHGPQIALSYFGPKGDELLQQMTFTGPKGVLLSQFSYTYNADDNVISFTQSYLNAKFATMAATGGFSNIARSLLNFAVSGGGTHASAYGMHFGSVANVSIYFILLLTVLMLSRMTWPALRCARLWRPYWPALLGATALLSSSCGGGGSSPSTPAPSPSPTPTPTASAQVLSYGYDAANRLVSALVGTNLKAGSGPPQFAYSYDQASNLTSIATNASPQSLTYSATNELSSGSYDANGSPTKLGSNTYTWDGANRVVSVTSGANESDFTYDGQSRLVRIVDKQGGNVVADKSYFWCGATRCLEHDNTKSGSPVSKQYFSQGVLIGGVAYYYVSDALGSVRQLVDASGNVVAQYDYDPYGNSTTISVSVSSDIGYAGYFHHSASGLDFALFRAYDSPHGRWLNRDPIGEAGGNNVYAYVGGNPLSYVDLSALAWQIIITGSGTVIVPGAGGTVQGGVGVNLDWGNSSIFANVQANGGLGGGAFVGAGFGLGGGHGDAPTTGTTVTNYVEGDAGWGVSGGASAALDDCGNVTSLGGNGPLPGAKIGGGWGAGAFAGQSATATIASPTIGGIWQGLLNGWNSLNQGIINTVLGNQAMWNSM